MAIEKIEKRDGKIVPFEREKITNAIYKATEAVGEPDYELADRLSQRVVEILEQRLQPGQIPKVEEVQDIVESVLIEAGKARVAKAYILYRRKRAEIRKEKQQILNKTEIDEVDKKFDINSLRVLASRYLKKDQQGRVIESPKELFQRVALHVTLPSLLYDKRVFQFKGKPQPKEKVDLSQYEGKLRIGKYVLNPFHTEALVRMYERFNKKGQMKVTLSQLLHMLSAGEFDNYEAELEEYYQVMVDRKFFPNTPALANFGRELGMGLACFVLDIEDSLYSIMETLKNAALIFKSGGGVGYNFSKLRPAGDYVRSTAGTASGPVTFMTLYDKMTEVIKQGGIRRGANMGILNSNHPDIETFVTAKRGNLQLRNFNISVLIKPDFWDYYKERKPYPLINPRTGEVVRYIDPQALFDLIAYQAWESAEPGLIFADNANEYNPFLETLGPIETTNPCGESLLYPNESCDLGSINLWAFARVRERNGEREVTIDWEDLAKTVRIATKFLDNILDVNNYPLPEIEEMSLNTRKIGLGIMGLADLLYEFEVPYDSEEGRELMGRLMEFVNYHSKIASVQLAKERGSFPYFNKSFYPKGKMPFKGFYERESWHQDWESLIKEIKEYGLRNAYTTIVAPTGSISMIAGCSAGIEPNFSLVYEKRVSIGTFYYVNPVFEKIMEREGLFDEALIREVAENEGSCQKLPYIPPKLKRVFVTSLDISAEDHIRALAEIQKWTDSSVSKTINFPPYATVEDIKKAYLLAHELGCKDITVYRYKSIKGVYTFGGGEKEEKERTEELADMKDVKAKGPSIYLKLGTNEGQEVRVGDDNEELCPVCKTPLIRQEGCKLCPNCGWGVCASG
ncbi:adenosylcobalamin-dependent ribonucleoside-diphosphate reductase [bacterium]|nr:adenosylcobalamin-dependent ribonucleoside-diphosphate reductase [bacterium]